MVLAHNVRKNSFRGVITAARTAAEQRQEVADEFSGRGCVVLLSWDYERHSTTLRRIWAKQLSRLEQSRSYLF